MILISTAILRHPWLHQFFVEIWWLAAIIFVSPTDLLVWNHGVFTPQELEHQDLEEVRFMVDVNLMGTFHLIKAALPAMKQRARATKLPASISIMSSQAGQV